MTRNACLAGMFGVLQAVAAAAQTPSGGSFQVNSYTTGGQYFPSLAMAPGGDFVVVWPSPADGSDYGVAVRRFTASGTPLGPEFLANGYTTFRQSRPSVAMDASGGFVVAWDTFGQDGSDYGIRQRRFDPQGNPLAGGAAVNTYTSGTQWYPAVASNPDGRFAVVWQSEGEDGSGAGIFGRIYDEAGTAVVAPFRINAYTTGNQTWPSVDMDDVGNVKAVYQSVGEDGWGSAIMYQRFNWNGTEAQRFLVNTSTIANQMYPSIAVRGDGAFVVVWTSEYGDGYGTGIFGRIFDSAGTPSGPDFQINTYTTASQNRPRVAMDSAGDFVVVWVSYRQDGDHNGVFGQRFSAAGVRQGGEFQVNTYTTNSQFAAAVARSAAGGFVVAWSSEDDSDGYGIFAQRYGDLIFQDGFEAGP
jgi:hypothetical protein